MRVAFSTLGRISINNIQAALSNIVQLRQQVASGRKFQLPSQDPLGAQRSITLTNELANFTQYKDASESGLLYLESAQSSLLDLGERLREAKSIALSQRNATADSGSRDATAVAIHSIRDQIMTLMNMQVQGRYLFGGHLTKTTPFAVGASGGVEYFGDEGEITFQIGPSQYEVTNIPGSEIAGTGASFFVSVADLFPVVTGATQLSSLNRSVGVTDGQFQIEVGVGNTMTVDTTGMTSVQDLINQINGGGIGVFAMINPSQDGIRLVAANPADNIAVTELNGGTTAFDLGLIGSAVGTLEGGPLDPSMELSTPLTDIPALTSLPLGSIRILIGGNTVTTNFSTPPPAATIGEVIGRFNLAIPELTMALSPDGTTIQVTGTEPFVIEDNGADTTASQLGLVGTGQRARLFGSLEALEQALFDNDGDAIDVAMAEMELVIDDLVRVQGVVASRMQRIDTGLNLLDAFHLSSETRLADIQSTEMAEAITSLSEAQAVYQTALGTAASIYDLNLFHYIYR